MKLNFITSLMYSFNHGVGKNILTKINIIVIQCGLENLKYKPLGYEICKSIQYRKY